MTARRTPTQLQRVARALERYGRITQADFDPPAIDGLPPVRRVASRISELRAAGWKIDGRQRLRGMSLYRLVAKPPAAAPTASRPAPPEALFTPAAPRPASPYDADAS